MADIIKMPALSDTMTSGTLVAWHKKVGDAVKDGELLAEIETDKAVMEFQSLYTGVLLHIGVAEGASVPVDTIIAIIGKATDDVQKLLANDTPAKTAPVAVEEVPFVPTVAETVVTHSSEDGRLKASPLAKAIAKEEGIDLSQVKGSGDDGRIVRKDVEAALLQQKPVAQPEAPKVQVATPADSSSYEDTPLTQMRKTIARRLSESKFSAPHFYLTMEITMDNCMDIRTKINAMSDVKISFNDFIIKAVAKSLTLHPTVNSSWLGDKIRTYKYVNIGVAVAMDEGLMVPVIKNADTKSLSAITKEVKELADKARDRKIQPAEMQGNTFTISNLGMFGIEEFTAIINPPDACILAVGRISEKLVMDANNNIRKTNVMKVTLSCDHRVVDGAQGAKFLQTLKGILEEPLKLII